MAVHIVGWSHLPFGRLEGMDLEALIVTSASRAIRHAGITGEDVDGVWLGNLNGGFTPDLFCSSLVMQADAGLRWKPATRVENACASGATAVYAACDAIEAGRADVALVVGAEKMTAVSGAQTTQILANCSYVPEEAAQGLTFPGIFAQVATAYFQRYGNHAHTLARIAAKNHANGARNPLAHLRRELSVEFCDTVSEKNPIIAAPLRKTDCSLVSDGAAALVLASERAAARFRQSVRFRARVQVNDYLPMSRRDPVAFEGPRRAWTQALEQARCGVDDLSFAEVHDCFTIAELLAYEAMGLAAPGQGHRLLDEGVVYPEGRLPVNPSGGLKAKGHPIGATGVSMHVMAAQQLLGQAGEIQLPAPELAGVFNMGGAAVANFVSILEPVR